MPRTEPIYRGTSAAVILILLIARDSGITINRTKLAKLLYLADLRAVENGLPPGSDVEWLWQNYGPYSNTLREIEEDLVTARVIGVHRKVSFSGGRERRLNLVEADPQLDIDEEFVRIAEAIMNEFGDLSAGQLRNLSYQTAPMVAAKALKKREVRLDLAGGDPYPNMGPTLARLRRVVAALPEPENEEGGIEDLAADMEAMRALRLKATSHLVDAE